MMLLQVVKTYIVVLFPAAANEDKYNIIHETTTTKSTTIFYVDDAERFFFPPPFFAAKGKKVLNQNFLFLWFLPVDWETGEERTQHAPPHKRRTRIGNVARISRRLNRPARNC
jgi:hypothetical protein